MSPVALTSPSVPAPMPSPGIKEATHSRPSPWTDLAHSLSETSLPPSTRHSSHSTPGISTGSPYAIPTPWSPPTPPPQLSSSALREWDRLLLESSGSAKRHHLIHPSVTSPTTPGPPSLRHTESNGSLGAPKLAAESDKEGHIEYKLKLIDPTPDRFERLVTQMLWRLKQGRNEAIYEIGLADDGTVIGLTRAEMDASLRTLEQMAAEVGATVLILKEIVLSGSAMNLGPLSHTASSPSSSALSISSSYSGDGTWTIRRPDLDDAGKPRRGSRSLGGTASGAGNISTAGGASCSGKSRCGGKKEEIQGNIGRSKRVVFDPVDMGEEDTDSPSSGPKDEEEIDEDIPPFHLDLDTTSSPLPPTPNEPDPGPGSGASTEPEPDHRERRRRKWKRWKTSPRRSKKPPVLTPEILLAREEKSKSKAARSAEKREMRRLELYRGDGKDPMWSERVSGSSVSASVNRDPADVQAVSTPVVINPYQPSRPSSLRLATPNSDVVSQERSSASTAEASSRTDQNDDTFLTDLLHIPLDNLSLSFAEVQTVTDPSSAYSAIHTAPPDLGDEDDDDDEEDDDDEDEYGDDEDEQTEYATSPSRLLLDTSLTRPSFRELIPVPSPILIGNEMICVEALVVRKTAEGVAGVREWGDADDSWGFGDEEEDE